MARDAMASHRNLSITWARSPVPTLAPERRAEHADPHFQVPGFPATGYSRPVVEPQVAEAAIARFGDVEVPDAAVAARHPQGRLVQLHRREQLVDLDPLSGWQRGERPADRLAPSRRGGERVRPALALDVLDPAELVGRASCRARV